MELFNTFIKLINENFILTLIAFPLIIKVLRIINYKSKKSKWNKFVKHMNAIRDLNLSQDDLIAYAKMPLSKEKTIFVFF